MYQRLRQDLLARIRRGEFTPGSLLPSENQLCKQYGVSVTTARRAFLELVKEGVVQRKAGVGTMVAPIVRHARLSFLSIDYEGDAWRRTPSAMGEIVSGIGAASWQRDASFSMTGVGSDEAVGYLRRLAEERTVDGVLIRAADDIGEKHLKVLENTRPGVRSTTASLMSARFRETRPRRRARLRSLTSYRVGHVPMQSTRP
ncbi:GntR family transcriptional regulator [Rubrobacter radiotolerans]|nr:GntR family transcriptional regulator [Rubrobacter radiotolerans]